MAAVTISEVNALKISKVLNINLLNKIGFSKSFPKALVYAPRELGDIGIRNLNVLSMLVKIKMLVKHIRAQTSVGKARRIILE